MTSKSAAAQIAKKRQQVSDAAKLYKELDNKATEILRTGLPGYESAISERDSVERLVNRLANELDALIKENKRVQLTKAEKDFIVFLERTLIPDLKESGSEGYVKDFEEGLDFIEYYENHGRFGGGASSVHGYLEYLHNTIIPDTIESRGRDSGTARDLKRMAKMIERRLK